MKQWPTTPDWVDPTTLNQGNQFEAGNNVAAEDINLIVKDLIHVYNKEDNNNG